ncbi:carbohydrate kinase [Paenibacillus antri]|uniref:Carbohydrate kinase n=1 Tax=Paenibacillus antri TaxID=2582848 RepID=A0A5R9G8F6_9BACL|nr:PfkB family carbohydrate kinase [Paenibacillus antri]TLS49023.1 carbohydrate kinase [Paenibacillus antri]
MEYDVVALGELLIDFTPYGAAEEACFQKNAGGAPANVLAALAKLGKRTGFIGKVGRDRFGEYLAGVLERHGVSSRGVAFSETEHTTLAFVELDEHGERSFVFYRKPGADMTLREDEIEFDMIANANIVHFGSISMTHEPSRSATLKAIRFARSGGALVSFDPNLRPPLWPSLDAARAAMLEAMRLADVVKVSEEELAFLTGTADPESGSSLLYEMFSSALIFVTRGASGCFFRAGDRRGFVPSYPVKPVDTTGAGDAFLGGALFGLLEAESPIGELSADRLRRIAAFGNAAGALATTRRGGIPAMPSHAEVIGLMG